MRRKRILPFVIGLIVVFGCSVMLPGCGTIRSHWGVEHEYDFDGDYHHRYHKKHKKHKKDKKHKKHKGYHRHDMGLSFGGLEMYGCESTISAGY